jgi:hypothetical protein
MPEPRRRGRCGEIEKVGRWIVERSPPLPRPSIEPVEVSAIAGNAMKRLWTAMWVAAAVVAASAGVGHAQQGGIAKAKADAFDGRMFASPPGKKASACFVRRYDADHLAQHPKQKVGVMQLLVSTEIPSDPQITNYSFRLGIKYRHRSGDFDSSGDCGHVVAADTGQEIRLGCGVDCDGGGIEVALSKDDKSAIVRLERITVWQRNKPDDDARDALLGADDKMFRLDRAATDQCAALVTDRKELAALRHR